MRVGVRDSFFDVENVFLHRVIGSRGMSKDIMAQGDYHIQFLPHEKKGTEYSLTD